MHLSIIVAYDQGKAIGSDNKLLWHLADDMAFFKKMTTNQVVIMGRKTYDSLPERFRPLPNRVNIVITRSTKYSENENLKYATSISQAIEIGSQYGEKEIFIIGGGEVYKESIVLADIIYATEVDANLEGDTFFAKMEGNWSVELLETHSKNEKNDYDFKILKYSRNSSN